MASHVLNMLLTSLIIATSFHALYYEKKRHRWHHHFLLYFGILFIGGLAFAWLMYVTEATGYHP